MGKVCEVCPECGSKLSEEMIEANLCWECGKILDESLLEDISESNVKENEKDALDILGYQNNAILGYHYNNASTSTNRKTSPDDTNDGKAKKDNKQEIFNKNTEKDVKGKRKVNKVYYLKYNKTLSTEEKREWIERYIGIKKFVAGIYALIGLLVGILVANVFELGMGGYIVCILLGCGIASALGTNAVGTAMMEAITAEQSIITEELLTELLNNSQKE